MRNATLFAAMLVACVSPSATAQPTPPPFRLVPQIRLDAAQEDFTTIGFVVVAPNGTMVVDQPQDFQLRLYDAAGKRIATFGRQGGGPGEFAPQGNAPIGMAGSARSRLRAGMVDDTLWVYDSNAHRITYASLSGQLIRTALLPAALPSLTAGGVRPEAGTARRILSFTPYAVYGDGAILGWATVGRIEEVDNGRGGTTRMQRDTENPYLVVDGTGAIRVRVATPPEDPAYANVNYVGGGVGMLAPFRVPMQTSFAQDGQRIVFLSNQPTSREGGTFRVVSIRPTGDTAFSRSFPFTGRAVSASQRDSSLTARMRTYRERAAGRPSMPSTAIDELESKLRAAIPPVTVPITSILVGLDHTIWLAGEQTPTARPYVALDAAGVPFARIEIKRGSRLLAANRNTIWVIEFDADDLPTIVRYGLERDPG